MTSVHLIYIHGFQGNDTSFQSFPTDLHKYLTSQLPNTEVRTSIYPTYKSAKPLSFATHNFLEWLSTQPPEEVILLGHSMGGLLAAEAATDLSIRPQRIIGVMAFDTPYLGIHPHVVISGIASLLPKDHDDASNKDEPRTGPTIKELNDRRHVNVVDDNITDDWERFKGTLSPHSFDSQTRLSRSAPSSPVPSRSRSPQPSPLLDHTIDIIVNYSNESFGRWLRKHADEPFLAGKRWIVEHFQFGACMLDTNGLRARYDKLAAWGGKWVNYWTETVPKKGAHKLMNRDGDQKETKEGVATSETLSQRQSQADSSISIERSSVASPTPDTERLDLEIHLSQGTESTTETTRNQQEEKVRVKNAKRAENKHMKGRHFVIRPDRLGCCLAGSEKWEKVLIKGVDDEVAAHCGLFIRGQNTEYERLIERVGKKIVSWCSKGLGQI